MDAPLATGTDAAEHRRARRRRAIITDLLTEKRWKLIDLARHAGVSKSFVTRLLQGTRTPTERNLLKVSKALGVSPALLIDPPLGPLPAPDERAQLWDVTGQGGAFRNTPALPAPDHQEHHQERQQQSTMTAAGQAWHFPQQRRTLPPTVTPALPDLYHGHHQGVVFLPVVEQAALAGGGNYVVLEEQARHAGRVVPIPLSDTIGRTLRAISVSGDCLEAETHIYSGDVVILDVQHPPQNGDLICMTLADRRVTVLKYYYEHADRIELHPDTGQAIVIPLDSNGEAAETLIYEGRVWKHIRDVPRKRAEPSTSNN